MKHLYVLVFSCDSLYDFAGSIRRSVVYHNNLKLVFRISQLGCSLKNPPDHVFLVMRRDENRYGWTVN